MKYYIGDQHFFCNRFKNGCKEPIYKQRGFSSVSEMNEFMIKQWNAKVSRKDKVYVLGDFSEGNAKNTAEILERLSGQIHLIIGNYDYVYLSDPTFDSSSFNWIEKYAEVEDEGRLIDLFHYPIICYRGSSTGAYMLYGHVHNDGVVQSIITKAEDDIKMSHGTKFYKNHILNCFAVYSNYVPLSLDEWVTDTAKRIKNEALLSKDFSS